MKDLIPHRMYYVNEELYLISEQYAVELALKGYTIVDMYQSLDIEPEMYEEEYAFCYDTKTEKYPDESI